LAKKFFLQKKIVLVWKSCILPKNTPYKVLAKSSIVLNRHRDIKFFNFLAKITKIQF